MRKSIYILCVVIVVFALLFFVFNRIVQKSPSETVIAAYTAGNQGKYAEAKKSFSSEFLNFLGGDLRTIAINMSGTWKRNTKNGTMERIEILQEKIQGNRANVYFILYFKDGSKETFNEPLIKEDGVWKITLG